MLGSRKCSWTSRSSRSVSSLKPQLRILIAQTTHETALDAHGRIDRHLRRAAFVIGPLKFRRLPFDAELVERLARRVDESAARRQHRPAGEPGCFGAAIDAVAETHEGAVPHQAAQRAQHLILAAEIAELARQEYVVPPAGDPFPDPRA